MRPLLRWAGWLAATVFVGWRMLAVLLLLLLAAWLPTSDLVDADPGVGYFLDVPALMMSHRAEADLGVLGGFLLLTADLLTRTVRTGAAAYAAVGLGSRTRWWTGTALAVVIAAVGYTALTMLIALSVGALRLGVTPHPGPRRAHVLAAIELPEWTTRPSPGQLVALLGPLLCALLVIGLSCAVVGLLTASPALPALPAAVALLASLATAGKGWPVNVFGAVDVSAYRRFVLVGGAVWPGVSVAEALLAGACWVMVIFGCGWWRVRRRGLPLTG